LIEEIPPRITIRAVTISERILSDLRKLFSWLRSFGGFYTARSRADLPLESTERPEFPRLRKRSDAVRTPLVFALSAISCQSYADGITPSTPKT
jgi:hypothetical protein